MKRTLVRSALALAAYTAVLYPVFVWYGSGGVAFSTSSLFPVFGLIAFSVMWLHVVGAALRPLLEQYMDFEQFVHRTSLIVLICIVLHPLLFLMALGFQNVGSIFSSKFIWFALFGWLFLITYDLGKLFKKRKFFIRHWEAIKIVSTAGFFLVFFHSLGLGSHLQTGPLRVLWIFYGVSAALAALYTYVVQKLLRSSPLR